MTKHQTTINYEPEICPCCKQSTTYLIPIDPGTINIVKKIALFIGDKGINAVHPRKEMEGITLSSNDVGNLSRPRIHGLIARVKGNPGNYCLTTKGSAFLHGMPIPKYAIRSKVEHKTVGYYMPDTYNVVVYEGEGDIWQGINYDIKEGNIIEKREIEQTKLW